MVRRRTVLTIGVVFGLSFAGLLQPASAQISTCVSYPHAVQNPLQAPSITFYVATDGSDDNPGTRRRPFATLEAARDAIRALRQKGPVERPIEVLIKRGIYFRSSAFKLVEEDSGAETTPVTYRAYRNKPVRMIGGVHIPAAWGRPIDDAAILARLDPSARAEVVAIDLKGHGITDYGEVSIQGPMLELFCRGRRLPLARWPNEGNADIGQVVEVLEDSSRRLVDGNRNGNTFQYIGDRPERWLEAPDAVLHGFWWYGWTDEHVPIERIDVDRREITLKHGPSGGIRKDQWYSALNLLEEIDRPGEWYLDRTLGLLYLWPPEGYDDEGLMCSTLAEPLVTLGNTSYVTLEGLTLEVTRGVGVVLGGGQHNRLAGCIIRDIGSNAVVIDHGASNGVLGCDIHDVGSTGVHLRGGNRSTLEPANNYVLNCHIHHYAQRKKVYQPAARLYGCGHLIAHNLIHDAPHQAIAYDGNEHLIEFNEIHDVVLESSDAGVLYTGRDWTFRGNVVRHNFIHHIPHRPEYGSVGVYLDDCASSTAIVGNVFYAMLKPTFIGGGRDNIIENNVFVDCKHPVHFDTRGLTWDHFRPDGPMYDQLKALPYDRPPWSTRYPALARILDEHPQAPMGSVVAKNVVVRCTEWKEPPREYCRSEHNLVTEEDPGFVDAARMDFRLRKDSTVYRDVLGFQTIPFDRIGLYKDQYRATWPPPAPRKRPPL